MPRRRTLIAALVAVLLTLAMVPVAAVEQRGATTVRGRVLDAYGTAVQDADVRLVPVDGTARPPARAATGLHRSTGVDGTFSLDAPRGTFVLVVETPPGSTGSTGQVWDDAVLVQDGVPIRIGEDTTHVPFIEVTLQEPIGYDLAVVDDETGRPIAGAEVFVASDLGLDRPVQVTTDSQGRAEVPAAAGGLYRFAVHDPSGIHEDAYLRRAVARSSRVGGAVEVELLLTPDRRGELVVRFTREPSGTWVRACYQVYDEQWRQVLYGCAGPDGGDAEEKLPAGRYYLGVDPTRWTGRTFYPAASRRAEARLITVRTGQHTSLSMPLAEHRGSVHGVLVDTAGAPLAGVTVGVRRSGSTWSDFADIIEPTATDDAGRFEIDYLRPGTWRVQAYPDPGFASFPASYDAVVGDVSVEVPRLVVVPEARVAVEAETGSRLLVLSASGELIRSTETRDGRAVVAGLSPGDYLVRIDPPFGSAGAPTYWGATGTRSDARLLHLEQGETADLGRLDYLPGATLAGRVRDQDGRGLRDRWVVVTPEETPGPGNAVGIMTTDGEGGFAQGGLAPGRYVVDYYCGRELDDDGHVGGLLGASRLVTLGIGEARSADVALHLSPTEEYSYRRSCSVGMDTAPSVVGTARVHRRVAVRLPSIAPRSARAHVDWYVGRHRVGRSGDRSLLLRPAYRGRDVVARITVRRTGYAPLVVTTRPRRVR